MTQDHYQFFGSIEEPDFASEHRYVVVEKEFARRQVEQLEGKIQWRSKSLNLYAQGDWRTYLRRLNAYDHQLEKHAHEITEGLIPVHVSVENLSRHGDHDILVKLEVIGGTIRPQFKAPVRPPRMDGAPNKATKTHWHWPQLGGFSRTQIKIGPKTIEAKLSQLGPHDNALLVNQIVYVRCHDDTRLLCTVMSRNVRAPESHIVQF